MSKRDKHTPLLCTQKNTGLNEWIRIRRHFNPGVYQCRKPGIELRVRWEGVGPLRVDRLYWKRGRRALWLVATPIRDGEGRGARGRNCASNSLLCGVFVLGHAYAVLFVLVHGFFAAASKCCQVCYLLLHGLGGCQQSLRHFLEDWHPCQGHFSTESRQIRRK